MKNETSQCCCLNEAQILAISGKQVNLNEIKHILESHEAVREAELSTVEKEDGGHMLHASVVLRKDHYPSDELKLELAWHVGIESGNFTVFQDIDFSVPSDCQEDSYAESMSRRGIVHISGHRVDTIEVEKALMKFDGVLFARVIGVPDKKKGEILKAFITLKEGLSPSNDLKTELAWNAVIEVGPMVVFKEITFGDFQLTQDSSTGTHELGIEKNGQEEPVSEERESDGMVIVDEVNQQGEVIHVSSHKISTTEITQSLLSHPYIADAAVVTVPDDDKGETMKAFVKLKNGVTPSNDLKLELAWHVMTDLKPISVFKSIDLESSEKISDPIPEETTHTQKMINEGIEEMIAKTKGLSERVEYILANHEAVSEAIVIPVKDSVHGQALQAFVTLNDGFHPTEDLMEELAWHSRAEIGSSVVFKSLKFRHFFPVTKSRKTLESLLKADSMEIPTMMSITIAD
jgi:acyl-coenzyme A synthetase/AMP-(fatty) acid ligase